MGMISLAVACNIIGSTTCYFVIAELGSLTLSIMTNIRKFLSVIISVIIYSHSINEANKIVGLSMTLLFSLLYLIETKKTNSRVVK